MKIAIVGLSRSGKTTLFNALTGLGVSTGFSGQEAVHMGMCKVPDPRLERLSRMFHPKKTTPAAVEYVDLAGIAASREGEGGGISDELLGKIRPNEMLLAVVRAFESAALPHPAGSVDPLRDMEALWSEFMISDLSIVENRIARLEGDRGKPRFHEENERELALVRRCKETLDADRPLSDMELSRDDERRIRGFQFLTRKPLLVVVNLDERDIGREGEIEALWARWRERPRTQVVLVPAKAEADLRELEEEEAASFREELGLGDPAVARVARASYRLLGCISFFTVGDKEVRAWTIPEGTCAREAAGAIHDDMERGFIRAEVVGWEHLLERGSLAECRKDGSLRLEGKDYLVRDGEIFHVRFSV